MVLAFDGNNVEWFWERHTVQTEDLDQILLEEELSRIVLAT